MPTFEIKQRTTLYSGRVFDVQKVRMVLPDGREHTYDLVEHSGAVTLVPVDEQGNLWFVRQFRLGAQDDLLELPAGVLESGEDPLEAGAREIREEIGMASGELRSLGQFFMAPGYSSEYMHVYLASALRADPLQADADEFLEIVRIPVAEAYRMVESNQMHDGKTLAALLMARPFLRAYLDS